MADQRVKLGENDSVQVELEGVGAIYTIYTTPDRDGSIYVELMDDRNNVVIDEDNLMPEREDW